MLYLCVVFRIPLILLGCICVGLGALGIFVPGLPTTPFLLLASWAFYRSSPRLRQWLLSSRLGKYIRNYEKNKGLSAIGKAYAIVMMVVMCSISILFFIPNTTVKIIVGAAGLIGSIVVGFIVPTVK